MLQLDNCNSRFRHYGDCIYFLIVTFSTVGYGDMYPATRLGRSILSCILVFVLCFLPSLLSDIAELADGDDVSTEEHIVRSIAAMHEAVLDVEEHVGELSSELEDLRPKSSRTTPRALAPAPSAPAFDDSAAAARHATVLAALARLEERVASVERRKPVAAPPPAAGPAGPQPLPWYVTARDRPVPRRKNSRTLKSPHYLKLPAADAPPSAATTPLA